MFQKQITSNRVMDDVPILRISRTGHGHHSMPGHRLGCAWADLVLALIRPEPDRLERRATWVKGRTGEHLTSRQPLSGEERSSVRHPCPRRALLPTVRTNCSANIMNAAIAAAKTSQYSNVLVNRSGGSLQGTQYHGRAVLRILSTKERKALPRLKA